MRNHIRKTGQALVEFIIAASLLTLLLAASLDIGMIFFTIQALHNAAQEGASYGSLMNYEDTDNKDGDGQTFKDIFCSKPSTECTFDTSDPDDLGNLYEDFQDDVRFRATYEAGKTGGVGFSSLHDLDSNDIADDNNVRREYVDVWVADGPKRSAKECDPDLGTQCYIHVVVRARYKIFFPLAPIAKEYLTLESHYSMPLNRGGDLGAAGDGSSGVEITNTPTNTTVVTSTSTPTTIPTTVACEDVVSNLDTTDWGAQSTGNTSYTIGKTHIDSAYRMCSISPQIGDGAQDGDFSYYLFKKDDVGMSTVDVDFRAKMTEWTEPDDLSQTTFASGLMIRHRANFTHEEASWAGIVVRRGLTGYAVSFEGRTADNAPSQMFGDPEILSTGAPGSDNPLWLRLVKHNQYISAMYARCGSPPCPNFEPGDSDWVQIDEDGDPFREFPFLQVDARFGMALASGYNFADTGDDPTKAMYVTYTNVEMKAMEDFEAQFVHPDPALEDPFTVSSSDETNFHLQIDQIPTGSTIEGIDYVISQGGADYYTMKYESLDEDAVLQHCMFGGIAPDNCNSWEDFDPTDYNQFEERGVFDLVAYVSLSNNDTVPVATQFEIQDMQFDILDPADQSTPIGPTGAKVNVDGASEMTFAITAYDPKYGTDPAAGIDSIEYSLTSPSGADVPIDDPATIDASALCIFGGGGPGSCNPMPEDMYTSFAELSEQGTYRMDITVTSQDGVTVKGGWFEFDVYNIELEILMPNATEYEPDPNVRKVESLEQSNFEVHAQITGVESGTGIDEVRILIQDLTDGGNLVHDIDEFVITSPPAEFCVFGGTAGNCDPMPEDMFYGLPTEHEYMIMVQFKSGGSTEWTPTQDNPYKARKFFIPEPTIDIDFVDASGNSETTDKLENVVNPEDMLFYRVHAAEEGQPNGTRIYQVEFELMKLGETTNLLPEDQQSNDNGTSAYCVFSPPDGAPCQPMSDDFFNSLETGEYTIRARAQQEVGGSGGLWTEWVERQFVIPDLVIKFVDPHDDADEDDPDPDNRHNPDPDYHDDGYKLVRDLDDTRFEIQAYDPRYCDAYETTCEDDPTSEDCMDACNGEGVQLLTFSIYGAYDSDDDDFDTDDEIDELSTDDPIEYNEGDPLCVFDVDGNDCETMFGDQDEDDAEQDFNELERGKYFIVADVRSTDLNWVKAYQEFYIEDIFIEFHEDNWFRVIAYDPRADTEDNDIETGDGIEEVEFELFGDSDYDSLSTHPWPWQGLDTNPITTTYDPNREDGDEHERGKDFCMFGHKESGGDDNYCKSIPSELFDNLIGGRQYRIEATAFNDAEPQEDKSDTRFFTWASAVGLNTAFANPFNPDEVIGIDDTSTNIGEVSRVLANIEVKAIGSPDVDWIIGNGSGVEEVRSILIGPSGKRWYKTMPTPDVADDHPYCIFGKALNGISCGTPNDATYPAGEYTLLVRAQEKNEDSYPLWSEPKKLTFVLTEELVTPQRVTENLQALYTFEEGSGRTVGDVSGVGSALDLTINRRDLNRGEVSWIPGGGLRVTDDASIRSGNARKINDAVRSAGAVTLEAWVQPANTTQDGPSRIVSISNNSTNRNITLAQGLWSGRPANQYNVRLRTNRTGNNGSNPSLSSPVGALTTGLTHVVYTYDTATETARMYINGVEQTPRYINSGGGDTGSPVTGNLSSWARNYRLVLANERDGGRPWLGDIYLVAFYNKALTAQEVSQNFNAGLE